MNKRPTTNINQISNTYQLPRMYVYYRPYRLFMFMYFLNKKLKTCFKIKKKERNISKHTYLLKVLRTNSVS